MPQPEGAELEAVRARRAELKAKYRRPVGERPATPVRGVHHIALVAKDVESTVRVYQEFLGFLKQLRTRFPTGRLYRPCTTG